MLKSFIAGLFCALMLGGAALAQTCPAYTYTLTNGTTADANQVMANFNTVRTCVNALTASVLRDYIAGVTLSTAGSSATFGVSSGVATDSTSVSSMTLASSYTKTTSAWAVGSANGCLDSGTIANNTWYSEYLIQRTDTGIVDVLCSTSATAPTLPTPYTLFRRIGSMKTDGSGNWTAFTQNGDEFLWSTPVGDIAAASVSTTALTFTLSVPPGVKVNALFSAGGSFTAAGTSLLFSSPDVPSASAGSPAGNANLAGNTAGAYIPNGALNIRTNTSGQVRVIASSPTVTLNAATTGWIDTRGKNN